MRWSWRLPLTRLPASSNGSTSRASVETRGSLAGKHGCLLFSCSGGACDERRPVRIDAALDLRDGAAVLRLQQVGEPLLPLQPTLDRLLLLRGVRQAVTTVDDLVQRPEARFDSRAPDSQRLPSLVAPADGAVGEHVQESRPVRLRGALGLAAEVVPERRRGLRHVVQMVRDRDRGHVLSLLRLAETE